MHYLNDTLDFIEQGGVVIWAVFFTCLLLWTSIVERLWYYRVIFPKFAQATLTQWQARLDHKSWCAYKIREATISEVSMRLHARLSIIQTLIVICPLLGLLGTVTGMINVFGVISISGNSDAQSMAHGIYQATIPTMAGLVVALSGYYFSARLKQIADNKASQLADQLMLL
jgi:biopolymer transport protein ExbB